jgi:hypothetical protein
VVRDNNELNVPSCGRAAALRWIDHLLRVQVPASLRGLWDRRQQMSSQKAQWKREEY